MVDVTAKIVCDSVGGHPPRLTTFLLRYPKFVHGELMTHRTFSRNASSSRAIPVSKNLDEVRSDDLRAGPVYWASEQKGMQGGDELDDIDTCVTWPVDLPNHLWSLAEQFNMNVAEKITIREYAKRLWKLGALIEGDIAEKMSDIGVHKSIVNRRIESDLHINVLVSCCEPGLCNFFGLRLDRAAQPEMRVLAEQMWAAWNEGRPQKLEPGQWHLPFVDIAEPYSGGQDWNDEHLEQFKKVSVARCARLSYTSFETGRRSTVEEDLKLYDRLITSRPIHASPAEHQCTPDELCDFNIAIDIPSEEQKQKREISSTMTARWLRPELHGNLPGWVQYRKTLPGEAVAVLPEAYR